MRLCMHARGKAQRRRRLRLLHATCSPHTPPHSHLLGVQGVRFRVVWDVSVAWDLVLPCAEFSAYRITGGSVSYWFAQLWT